MCQIQHLRQIDLEQPQHTHEDPNKSRLNRFHPQRLAGVRAAIEKCRCHRLSTNKKAPPVVSGVTAKTGASPKVGSVMTAGSNTPVLVEPEWNA